MSRLLHIVERVEQLDELIPDPKNKMDAEQRRLVAEMCRILRAEHAF